MQYRIVTPFRKPPLTTNEQRRAHYYTVAKAKKEVADVVSWRAREQNIKHLGPSVITVIWYAPDKRKRDNDALAFYLKAAKDALCPQVWPDDSSEWVVEDRMAVRYDKDNPRIEILIEEVTDGQ